MDLPGLGIPVGAPSITAVPARMIRTALVARTVPLSQMVPDTAAE